MLKVHLVTGKTLRFDLKDEEDARRWADSARDSTFQQQITGLTLTQNGVQYSLPRPRRLDPIFLFADNVAPDSAARAKGAERIICHAGETTITLTVHDQQRAARVAVTSQGVQRYNPLAR